MLEVLVAAGVGLCLGSFTSVFVERLGVRGGIVAGRSECPSCGHVLAWYDLVPLVSFLALRGRCRYCGTAISPRYPLMELVMASALGAYAWYRGFSGGLTLTEMAIIVVLVMLFFFDLRHHLLPDELVIPLGALAVLRIAIWDMPTPVSAGTGALVLMLLFGLLHAGTRGRGMGFGDVGLGAALGLVFGWPVALFVLLCAVWAGALTGIILLATGRAGMKTALPFGSFLTAMGAGAMIRQDLFAGLAEWFLYLT
ncbi:MAG TPA: prepilin peptidase [Candidatus Paceibacterota bacterium]|nr:prepilin peptidase [Candidatus Paceibacterota bacterium]